MTSVSLSPRVVLRLPRDGLAGLRSAWLESVCFTALAALFCTYSIRGQLLGTTHGYDLGIFTQGVRGYAEGIGPISSIKGPGFSLLGDHFSPVTALIAPFYAVFPTPITLLVVQALLVALSAVPITRLFIDWFGRPVAVMATASYGISFGVANAIGFDFHEVAFGAPLLAFAMVALARRKAIATIAWSAPLVLVKEDMGFTVAAIGVVLALATRRRILGGALSAFGLVATAVEVKVLIPAFNPSGRYAYSGQLAGLHPALHALLSEVDVKAVTVLCLLAVTGFVGLRSPLMLIVLPTLAWRFTSDNPNYWGTVFHYGLLLMPIAFVALADGVRRIDASGLVNGSIGRVFVAISLVVSVLLIPTTPFFTLFTPGGWRQSPQAAAVSAAVRLIPDGATVAASGTVIPQIVTRTDDWLIWNDGALERNPQWVVVDTITASEYSPDALQQRQDLVYWAMTHGWHQVFEQDGVYALRR